MATTWNRLLKLFLVTLTITCVVSWDTDDFEIFDVVEEVNRNFYELMEVEPSATTSELRRAYRKLSLQLHPDKNKAADADVQFRQMVAVYEILKDEDKRQRYDRVLVEGMPDWRQPVFYYRRVRKMGMVELTGLLSVIFTIGQYLVAWAIYAEKRLSLEDFYASKKKLVASKNKKKSKIGVEMIEEEIEEELKSLPQPSLLDLWMFRLPGFLIYLVSATPSLIAALKDFIGEKMRKKEEEEEEEFEEEDGEGEKGTRVKRKKAEIPEYQADLYKNLPPSQQSSDTAALQQQDNKQKKRAGEWGEEELILLAKAVSRFPGGTANRWEKIAEFVGRTVEEVTLKSKQVKGATYNVNVSSTVQGAGFSGKNKKRDWDISDSIISTSNDLETEEEENKLKKRNKPPKAVKSADRTLLIPENVSKPKEQEATVSKNITQDSGKSVSDSGKVKVGDDTWTQNQQMIFEWALKHIPKTEDKRWEKIADQIPGKTKEDCILRFKYLADLVKKKKQEALQAVEQK